MITSSGYTESAFYIAEQDTSPGARIKVVGVGGGGGNAVNTMIASGFEGVTFIAANTDKQVLGKNLAPIKMQLGHATTKGLGAGGNPEVGRISAEEDVESIRGIIMGADMIFITAGMGGGTGTGAAPVIARVARELDILTIAVVTKPFAFEGDTRLQHAEKGLDELQKYVDTIIIIPNDKLKCVMSDNATFGECFKKVDEVLLYAVKGISDLVNKPGHINLDFADIKATMKNNRGIALVGLGSGAGIDRARKAAKNALSSSLLGNVNIKGTAGLILNITAGSNIPFKEILASAEYIRDAAGPNADVKFGVVTDPNIGDEIRITIVATGIHPDLQEPVIQAMTKPADAAPKRRSAIRTLEAETGGLFGDTPSITGDGAEIPAYLRKRKHFEDGTEDPVENQK